MAFTACSRATSSTLAPTMERRVRPQKEQALNCPRCNSTNTKFCYYNNYSLTQPRYFCKTCRRYWTEGGSLRNVPVGGGSRKNKRPSSSSSSPSIKTTKSSSVKAPCSISHHLPPPPQNPRLHEVQDLNLAFKAAQDYPRASGMAEFVQLSHNIFNTQNNENCSAVPVNSSLLPTPELLSGISLQEPDSFTPMSFTMTTSCSVCPSGFDLPPIIKPSLNYPLDGLDCGYENGNSTVQGVEEGGGRLLFPFEGLKEAPSTSTYEQNKGQDDHSSSCYWNGMLGGGPW